MWGMWRDMVEVGFFGVVVAEVGPGLWLAPRAGLGWGDWGRLLRLLGG